MGLRQVPWPQSSWPSLPVPAGFSWRGSPDATVCKCSTSYLDIAGSRSASGLANLAVSFHLICFSEKGLTQWCYENQMMQSTWHLTGVQCRTLPRTVTVEAAFRLQKSGFSHTSARVLVSVFSRAAPSNRLYPFLSFALKNLSFCFSLSPALGMIICSYFSTPASCNVYPLFTWHILN